MKYKGCAFGWDAELSVEREGLRIGTRFVDYADVASMRPISHRVLIETVSGESIELSMLGFSFDGFWDELTVCFGKRNLEALFVEEEQLMLCDGEYVLPDERGRAAVVLYPDAVCILPQTRRALRIPLCFTEQIERDAYLIRFKMRSGASYVVGRMGYDTTPFYERAVRMAALVKAKREKALSSLPLTEPFTVKGLFRTEQSGQYWNAAFGRGVCALEFFAGEDAATYLYRFSEPETVFLEHLIEATEAMGVHRELVFLSDEKLAENPLYRMAADRSEAVRFLRARSAGRLIHSANHAQRLSSFLCS